MPLSIFCLFFWFKEFALNTLDINPLPIIYVFWKFPLFTMSVCTDGGSQWIYVNFNVEVFSSFCSVIFICLRNSSLPLGHKNILSIKSWSFSYSFLVLDQSLVLLEWAVNILSFILWKNLVYFKYSLWKFDRILLKRFCLWEDFKLLNLFFEMLLALCRLYFFFESILLNCFFSRKLSILVVVKLLA